MAGSLEFSQFEFSRFSRMSQQSTYSSSLSWLWLDPTPNPMSTRSQPTLTSPRRGTTSWL